MNIEEKALKILEQPICDHCLGRQFSQLLSGFTNDERGKAIRTIIAMSLDGKERDIDYSNFADFTIRNLKTKEKEKSCSICSGIFNKLDKYAEKCVKTVKGLEFETFLIGTKPSFALSDAEETLWEKVGIDFCEPIKGEINRELGKKFEKKIGKKFSLNPDVTLILDIATGSIKVQITPLFIYGKYQKLKRGIPQTRWPSGKYKTSIEQITAKPFMASTKGIGHKFHGAGREDIDALCLAWRPFVLEILEPKKRKIELNKLAKKIKKDVKIKDLHFSSIKEVRELKEAKLDKTYRALIKTKTPIEKKDLKKIKIKTVAQQTPERVLHRRADLTRKRAVRKITPKFINSKTFELTITGESGLYIKELISGDNNRTKPSVSELLQVICECKELDVINIKSK